MSAFPQPVTIFTRGSRFIARATCPKCNTPSIGVGYHGVLMSGESIYQLAAHSVGLRAVVSKKGRCEGSQLRMQLDDDGWRAAS